MRFMITFTHVDGAWEALSDAERAKAGQALGELLAGLTEKGSRMQFFAPPATARTVRLHRDGRRELVDGVMQPGAEPPAGYFIIEADSPEEALAWAERGRFIPGATEVREILDMPSGN